MSVMVLIAAIIVSLVASAFFSGAETGLLSVSRERILHLTRKGGRRAKTIQRAIADMGRTTTAILIGNNIANVSYSAAATAAILAMTSDPSVRSAANVVAVVVILYFGEFLPKLLFAARPLRRTLLIIPAFQSVAAVLSPLTWLAMKLTDMLMPRRRSEHRTTAEEIMRIIYDRRDGVCLSDFEHHLVTRLIALRAAGAPITRESIYAAISPLADGLSHPADFNHSLTEHLHNVPQSNTQKEAT